MPLYGLTDTNSSRGAEGHWGKNQFNSSFPLSLCLYMRDQEIAPVSVYYEGTQLISDETHFMLEDVMGKQGDSLTYSFESQFGPYITNNYSRNLVDKIDLVVYANAAPFLPLEIKLTVIPDTTTVRLEETEWGPELVMRPVSSAYAMMGVAHSLKEDEARREQAIEFLRLGYNVVNQWENNLEISKHQDTLRDCLRDALEVAVSLQKPFLLQPIWKTLGQTLKLSDQCLDVFVWSDVAVMMLPVILAENENRKSLTRPMREVARHVRALYDLLSQGDYDYNSIYKGMSLGLQTDKAFAVSGRKVRGLVPHNRFENPVLPSSTLSQIILNDSYLELKPERRFDAAVMAHLL